MQSLWFETALLPGGWTDGVRFEILDGMVASTAAAGARQACDERHAISVPGLANVHSHGFQRGMAGLSEVRGGSGGDDFWTWRTLMYRFLDLLDPDDFRTITALAYIEMLES